ncbi:hypothetical protein Pr1d_32880 [Bythopirellula goksoeyrii]|uniref:Uncharacterized protein n=1 Tax=Bythopirellula goksoeyrii TaxID=1400387 RepID=A0A5B9QDV5_9BACT|nr:hypothetical protein Pr1d_32880 [Bythopirellula goksoeyrii]
MRGPSMTVLGRAGGMTGSAWRETCPQAQGWALRRAATETPERTAGQTVLMQSVRKGVVRGDDGLTEWTSETNPVVRIDKGSFQFCGEFGQEILGRLEDGLGAGSHDVPNFHELGEELVVEEKVVDVEFPNRARMVVVV